MTTLNIIATMRRKTEATNGPPIPATYDSPTQNNATEITSTNIQTKAIIKFLLSIVIYLPFKKFFVRIYVFLKNSFPLCANTYLIIPKTFEDVVREREREPSVKSEISMEKIL